MLHSEGGPCVVTDRAGAVTCALFYSLASGLSVGQVARPSAGVASIRHRPYRPVLHHGTFKIVQEDGQQVDTRKGGAGSEG